ncbi:hypothetical protein D6C67_24015, partial [Escherichia coli]
LQALSLDAEGHGEAAQALREQAFDAAPAVPGRIGEAPFAWLADADTRLGPFVTDAGETALFDLRELDFEPTDA